MRGHHKRIKPVLLTVKDVADALKVSQCTIYRLLKERQLPAFRIGGDWRFNREDLARWIRQSETHSLASSRDSADRSAQK